MDMDIEFLVEVVVAGLAAFALGWFVTTSYLMQPWAKWLGDKTHNVAVEHEDIHGNVIGVEFEDPKSKPHEYVWEWLTCPICIGWWFAIALWVLPIPTSLVGLVAGFGIVKALNR